MEVVIKRSQIENKGRGTGGQSPLWNTPPFESRDATVKQMGLLIAACCVGAIGSKGDKHSKKGAQSGVETDPNASEKGAP